jgi:hypothetical protein
MQHGTKMVASKKANWKQYTVIYIELATDDDVRADYYYYCCFRERDNSQVNRRVGARRS